MKPGFLGTRSGACVCVRACVCSYIVACCLVDETSDLSVKPHANGCCEFKETVFLNLQYFVVKIFRMMCRTCNSCLFSAGVF